MADEQEQFGVKFQAGTESVIQAKEDFKHLTQEMEQTSKAGETVATATKTVDEAAAELRKQISDLNDVLREQARLYAAGELPIDVFIRGSGAARTVIANLEKGLEELVGSDEGGGFKGVASNVMKAEKVISGLVSGSGFGRMGSMLESITGALGLTGGVGMAAGGLIFAFESAIPKIEKFIEKITGAGEAAKKAADQIKEAEDLMAKFIAQPTEEEEAGAKAIKPLLAGRGGVLLSQGVEQALRQGLAPDQRRFLEQFETAEAAGIEQAPYVTEQAGKLRGQITAQRGQIMKDLMAGRPSAISEVSGMAGQFPGLFPAGTEQHFRQALPENLEAARQQARQAEVVSAQAETEYSRREAKSKAMVEAVQFAQDFGRELTERQNKETDRALESTMRSDEAFNKKLEHDRIQADRKAEQDRKQDAAAQRRSEVERARRDRENMPQARENRARAAEQNEEMGMAQQVQVARAGAGDVLASQMGPQELQQIVAQVGRNRTMNSSLGFTLAQQVDFYMSQLEAKLVADFSRGMGQQNRPAQNNTPFGGF